MPIEPHEVLSLVEAERESELQGSYETQAVDFKGNLHLETQQNKWELAKDVAAMANEGGGLLAVGFATAIDPDRLVERVSEVKPFPAGHFDPVQIYDVVKEWVYPVPDVKAVRHPRGDKALGTILVRSQRGTNPPYLVTRMQADDKRFPPQVAFGWPRRGDAHTYWTPIGEVYRHLLPDVGAAVPSAADFARTRQPQGFDPTEYLDGLEATMGAADRSLLFLVACPEVEVDPPIPRFYSADGAEGALTLPLELRHAGFGLAYAGQVERDHGGKLIAVRSDRGLVVRPDGVAMAVLPATQHFLTRSNTNSTSPMPGRINPVVVTEWTYLFCRFVVDHLATIDEISWNVGIGLRGAKSRPWSLTAVGALWQTQMQSPLYGDQAAPGIDDWYVDMPSTRDAERDAYRLLQKLYEVFGLGYDKLGMSTEGRVPEEFLKRLSD